MANLGTLTLDLVAKVGGFTKPLDKAGRHHKKTAKQIAREQKKMRDDFKRSMVSIGKWGAAMAAAAAVGAVAMTKASFAAADVIGKTADAAGVTTDTLQEVRYAAEISGMAISELDKNMMGFGKRVGELRAGTGALYTLLNKTNKTLMAQIQTAPNVDAALNMIMDAMAGTADDADRAALAVAAFGRSGQKMGILSKSYKDLRAEAKELGLVIDEHLIRSAEKTNDQMTTLVTIVKTQLTSGLLELAPYIQSIATDLTEWVKANKDILSQDLPGYIKGIGEAVQSFVNSPAFKLFKEYWEIIAGGLAGLAVAGPIGALIGATGGAGLSIYSDLAEYFEKTLPEKIRESREELAELNNDLKTAPMYSTMFISGKRDVKIRIEEVKEELAEYENIAQAQRDITAAAREKTLIEREAAEVVKIQADVYERLSANMAGMSGDALVYKIADVRKSIKDMEGMLNASMDSGAKQKAQGEIAAQKDFLKQLTSMRKQEFVVWEDQGKKIMALDKQVQQSLELIHLDGYQKQLKALEQKQKEEIKKYTDAGADIVELLKLHDAQKTALIGATLKPVVDSLQTEEQAIIKSYNKRKKLIEDNVADHTRAAKLVDQLTAKKDKDLAGLLPQFASAPGFAGTGGASGELGMLEQQRDNLKKWYDEQKSLLDQARKDHADLNEKWNEKERQIEQEHSTQLARIQQARTSFMLTTSVSMFQSLADIQKAFTNEQDSTFKTLFAISKAFTVAETTLNMYNAVSDAWATGATVADKLAAASIVAGGMLTIVQSAQAVGLAHDGIDSVPETGTWLLQKGERVVAERTSKKLDDTLSRLQFGNGGMNVNIHEAPGTTAQVLQRSDGLDVQIALIEEQLTERMSRGTGMATALDSRYGRRG